MHKNNVDKKHCHQCCAYHKKRGCMAFSDGLENCPNPEATGTLKNDQVFGEKTHRQRRMDTRHHR